MRGGIRRVASGASITDVAVLAELERRLWDSLRESPDCVYEDTDSVILRDTPEAHRQVLLVEERRRLLFSGWRARREAG